MAYTWHKPTKQDEGEAEYAQLMGTAALSDAAGPEQQRKGHPAPGVMLHTIMAIRAHICHMS